MRRRTARRGPGSSPTVTGKRGGGGGCWSHSPLTPFCRPFYCSNSDGDDCTLNNSVVRSNLETLMHKYGVDLILEGHEHSYVGKWEVGWGWSVKLIEMSR